jgi:hypothetical protein
LPLARATLFIWFLTVVLAYALLAAGGRSKKSRFRPDEIVSGTERGERYWWPMEGPESCALRPWGCHATAFVGRRHFDAPDMFEKYFEMKP